MSFDILGISPKALMERDEKLLEMVQDLEDRVRELEWNYQELELKVAKYDDRSPPS